MDELSHRRTQGLPGLPAAFSRVKSALVAGLQRIADIAAQLFRPSRLYGVLWPALQYGYWLLDGLQDAGFTVHLVNTATVKPYDGLKHSGDFSDAHLLRLGILPMGYIYPREQRALRDLLRKRSRLARQRSTHVNGNPIKRWQVGHIEAMPLLTGNRRHPLL